MVWGGRHTKEGADEVAVVGNSVGAEGLALKHRPRHKQDQQDRSQDATNTLRHNVGNGLYFGCYPRSTHGNCDGGIQVPPCTSGCCVSAASALAVGHTRRRSKQDLQLKEIAMCTQASTMTLLHTPVGSKGGPKVHT